ncbi:MAG: MarR family winged helix-turn-helix transcriptional regulator [Bacteroidota bacterium]
MGSVPSGIQRELKQTRKFSTRAEEASVALLRTADRIRWDLERALGRSGVTVQQYNVLRILRGSEPEPLATLEIADRMIERAPGITRLLDRLDAAGLVTRTRSREDRRRVLCRITAKGLAVLEETDGPVLHAERRRAGRLSDADLKRLLVLLERLRKEEA